MTRLRIGLLVNPWAGIGGPVGLRGSDGMREQALARGARPAATERALRFLATLSGTGIDWLTWGGGMGADVLAAAGCTGVVAGQPASAVTSADDTRAAACALAGKGIDLLVFVGGDGTARDVCAAVGGSVPVLGVPAGVKMYSGVFAVSPEAGAEIVRQLAAGQPVVIEDAEVRDIDEDAFRNDRVLSRHFGELRVPGVRAFLQQVKCGGPETDESVRAEIAAGILEDLGPDTLYLVGTGTTPRAVAVALGLESSLLGIDAILGGRMIARDLDADGIRALLADHPQACLLLTPTGGQGFLLGRGNQQLAPDILQRIGVQGLKILATPGKLAGLGARPLLVDTGDVTVDALLSGLRPVTVGYRRQVLYRVQAASQVPESGQP